MQLCKAKSTLYKEYIWAKVSETGQCKQNRTVKTNFLLKNEGNTRATKKP